MNRLLGSLGFALVNSLHPRVLWLMVWPMLIALFAWGVAALALWTRTAFWIAEQLRQWLSSGVFLVRLEAGDWVLVVAHVLLFLLFVPLVYLTALLILSIFGMQQMVEHVAGRRFAQLERRRGGDLAGSLLNGAAALGGLALLALLSIPFWIVPPLWPLIPVAIMGWVNQRVLRYDALAEHASPAEMRAVFRGARGALYTLGVVLALLAYVPVVGFFAPVLFGLAFIHYLLGELEALRRSPAGGRVIDA
ncbi:MAG: EI24 domain-containing protein [Pseudomonadota bacterium]